ncbi:MAG: glycosyltransferase family 1 protein [Wenzhouxiangella sp.]|nr:MAG: glycosyltransferase family 1 protein [Wenzhouxiangella sp.]
MSRPSLLLSAYQCAPGQGSVSQIGWEWASRLARRRPVVLLTHIRNQAAIAAAGGLGEGSRVHYIDTEWLAGPLFRLARRLFPRSEHGVFLVASLDFFLYDWLALRYLRRARRAGTVFDLVHVVTPVTLAAPSRLHRAGLPVIRGPLNCGLHSPPGFAEQLRDESPWMIRLRELPRLLDGLFGSTRNARLILAATRATGQAVPKRHRHKLHPMLENGIDLAHFPAAPWPPAPGDGQALRVAFVGRMIGLKGVDLLLKAAARLCREQRPLHLTLVGDGPARAEWQRLAAELGIEHAVHFTGALDQAGVREAMADCHVFCLPSVRESGGAVLLEAMATARPVIALAHGGPAELVDETVGQAIAVSNPDQVVDNLATALRSIFDDPEAWQARGLAGRSQVVARWSWEGKISAAERLYQELVSTVTIPAQSAQTHIATRERP